LAKLKKKPPLKQVNKADRVTFANTYILWGSTGQPSWENVIFADAKKFNLDGPDGWNYYWHDLRFPPLYAMRRHTGGGGTMVYIFFTHDKKFKLILLDGSVDAAIYVDALNDVIKPAVKELGRNRRNKVFYLHDNARIHTSNLAKEWFRVNKIPLIKIPAYSPDLNPAENVLSMLCREVYRDGKQYMSVGDLKSGLKSAWNRLAITGITNCVMSMPKRMNAVIEACGGPIDY
jgi:hypothetical protein